MQLKVQKRINASPVPEGQTIAGAVYGVYESWESANINGERGRLHTLETDASGTTPEIALAPGTYYIRELSCPKWLELDDTIYPIEIEYGQRGVKIIESIDWIKPGYITLKKTVSGMQDYSIAGAEYGIYLSQSDADNNIGRIDLLVTIRRYIMYISRTETE